jgi:hypothetical protein
MGLSFRVAPGVRIRASSRGLSAGVGPRIARVHVGSRGIGVSSGVGPVSAYTRIGGSPGYKGGGSSGGRTTYGPTKASIAARERELRAGQREAEIGEVQAREKALVGVHRQTFAKAQRIALPVPEEVDPKPIRDRLELEVGVPALVAKLGNGDSPPVAAPPEPVDRYVLMREHRKKARRDISILRIGDRIRAARTADRQAEAAAKVEAVRRCDAQEAEQKRLDQLWAELGRARDAVGERLTAEVDAEKERRSAERASEQAELDAEWARLQANEPMTTIVALEQAFADNESPAAPINCEGNRTTVVMQFSQPEEIVPERKPAFTPGGKRTLKKRTKTEINVLYLEALGSNVLATVKEAFAVAPGTEIVQMLVIRREVDKKHDPELSAIYVGEFDRAHYDDASGSRQPDKALLLASESMLNLKGKTEQVAPLDLSNHPELPEVLDQVADGLES